MDLSILIPARNEMFLSRTIDDILSNIEGDTEVIAVLDGAWATPPIPDHPRVTLIYHPEAIGQRAATNEAARLSEAKFVMKCDAHCAFDKGFDVKLMADCKDDWTVVPRMYNLHVFDWKCKKCGNRTYQGPTPTKCDKCGASEGFERVMVWKRRESRKSDHWRFDSDLHFQYWAEFKKRPEARGDIVPTMSLIGAAWFMRRDRYWYLDGMDELHGSWGQMGTEIACKSWLSGGQLVTNKKTWFAHCFRTQGGDFGFPYPMKGSDQERARKHSRRMWREGRWPKAKYPLEWLVKKFAPVPGWPEVKEENNGNRSDRAGDKENQGKETGRQNTTGDCVVVGNTSEGIRNEDGKNRQMDTHRREVSKALVYYTDSHCREDILLTCRKTLQSCMRNGHAYPIFAVSQLPINFGTNIVMPIGRSVLSLYKQVLRGLEEAKSDIIFLIEHDVLYDPSHFDFVPPRKDTFYFNRNRWAVCADTGKAVFYQSDEVSLCCAYRELLIKHYKKAVFFTERDGFKHEYGFSPPRGIPREERVGRHDTWFGAVPAVDIRHSGAYTRRRMNKSEFRSERSCRDWQESDGVPGWGKTLGRFDDFLGEVWKRG